MTVESTDVDESPLWTLPWLTVSYVLSIALLGSRILPPSMKLELSCLATFQVSIQFLCLVCDFQCMCLLCASVHSLYKRG